VSNYDWKHLRGYEERILVGAEEVNGTGEVRLRIEEGTPGTDGRNGVFLSMPADDALEFAKLLSRQAHQAMRVKWNEANILSG
jgi:hypothetical protein